MSLMQRLQGRLVELLGRAMEIIGSQTWIRDLLRNHAHTNVISKDTLIVNQIDFMAFIGKVINLTAFVQTAKLMIIVEAATEFLGVTDVTVAMIVDMLTPNNTNDGMYQYDDN